MSWSPGDLVSLTTERFILRSATREDVSEDFLSWIADPEVMMGLNLPRKRLARPQAVRHVLSHDNAVRFLLMICPHDASPVGFFTVNVDPKHGIAETGVVIGDRAYWGKNVVVEARTALLDFLFESLPIHKVMGMPHGRNFSSIFNYKAMGFECEAVLREHMLSVDGETRLDQLIFAMFRDRWKERRSS